jgi:hypothetical protein
MATPVTSLPAQSTLLNGDLFAIERSGTAYSTDPEGILAPAGVHVDHHGAVGDGVTDDYAAIQAAIDAAGDGGVVIFSANKTYLYSRSFYFWPNQTFLGYGATLKRAATIASQISNVAGNDITVADGSLFAIGMEVAGWGNDDTFTDVKRVLGVAGNVVSLSGFDKGAESTNQPGIGDYLTVVAIPFSGVLSGHYGPLDGDPDNVRILGITFDGNEPQNNGTTAPLRWELMREISQLGDYSIISDCLFKSVAGEGVVAIGAFSKISNCHFLDINGNGVHFSGGDQAVVIGCTFNKTNLIERGGTLPYGQYINGMGHQEGAVTMSSGNTHCVISNITVDGALSAVGNISVESASINISNVTARNCDLNALDIKSDSVGASISNLNGDNCTSFDIRGTGHQLSNITLSQTPCVVNGDNMSITNIVSSLTGNTTDYCFNLSGSGNIILGATGIGGERGLNFSITATKNTVESVCKNNWLYGCAVASSADLLTDANQITPHIILESAFTASPSYDGIDFAGAAYIVGGSAQVDGAQRVIDIRSGADNAVIDGFNIIIGNTTADLVRINAQNDVTAMNMKYPKGTTSTAAFAIGASTGFTPINNYALASSAPLTGA